MIIRPADLILVRGTGIISDAIETVTHSPYSHLAGLVKPNELIEAQGLRRVGYQGLEYYDGQADVYTCDLPSDEQRARIVANVEKYIGRHYSYLLIGWELLRCAGIILVPGADWDPIMCSTLWINEGYRKEGIDPCPGVLFPTPADAAGSKLLRKIGSM